MPGKQVALLRGINVGKAKRVAMADLRALLYELGFVNVKTLLNSGNALYTSDGSAPAVAARRIEKALLSELKVQSRVLVLSEGALAGVVTGNPIAELATNPSRFFVSFLYYPADASRVKTLEERDWAPEVLAIGKGVVYQWCPAGLLESPLAAAVGKALGDRVTVRNWGTVTRLYSLASES